MASTSLLVGPAWMSGWRIGARGEHLLTAPRSTDQSRLLAGYVIVLKRMVPDKNVQVEVEEGCLTAATATVCHEVFLAAAALLHTVCQASDPKRRRVGCGNLLPGALGPLRAQACGGRARDREAQTGGKLNCTRSQVQNQNEHARGDIRVYLFCRAEAVSLCLAIVWLYFGFMWRAQGVRASLEVADCSAALQAHSALDPLMPLLVDRLGDSNALFLDSLMRVMGHASCKRLLPISTSTVPGAPSGLHGAAV